MHIEFSSLRETFNELVSDVEAAKKLDTDFCSEDFIKRTYTRAFFAMIEGVISQLKKMALAANEQTECLQWFEVDLLKERSACLASNGVAKETKVKLQLMPNIVFSLNYSAKALDLDYTVKKGEVGYKSMLDAVKIRDRITHPKGKSCLSVSNEEMTILGNANVWFRDEVGKLMNLIHEKHDVV